MPIVVAICDNGDNCDNCDGDNGYYENEDEDGNE
jgi:hypothetical protein